MVGTVGTMGAERPLNKEIRNSTAGEPRLAEKGEQKAYEFSEICSNVFSPAATAHSGQTDNVAHAFLRAVSPFLAT